MSSAIHTPIKITSVDILDAVTLMEDATITETMQISGVLATRFVTDDEAEFVLIQGSGERFLLLH